MKNINTQYKKENAGNYWLQLLQWLRLLILSLTRTRDPRLTGGQALPGIFFHEPATPDLNRMILEQPPIQNKTTNNKKLSIMKTVNRHIKWAIMLLLIISATKGMAQTPPLIPGNHSVCVGITKDYGVPLTTGSTYAWSISPASTNTIIPGAFPNLISISWTSTGVYTVQVIETFTSTTGCVGDPVSITVTVNALPVVTCPANSSVCISVAPYALTGASPAGGTYSGTGVSAGNFNPATAGPGTHTITYTYTDPATTCTNTCTFTITVNALPTATISYAATPYCISGTASSNVIVPVTQTGQSGGTYTSSPAGLVIDPNTGAINLTTSSPGTYTVTYTFTNSNGCTNTTTTTVVINPKPATTPITHN